MDDSGILKMRYFSWNGYHNKLGLLLRLVILMLSMTTLVALSDIQDFEFDLLQIKRDFPGFPESEMAFVRQESQKLQEKGIDPQFILTKTREGLVKGVEMEALRDAILKESQIVNHADTMLLASHFDYGHSWNRSMLVQAIVLARKQGAVDGDCRAVLAQAKGAHATEVVFAIDILGELAEQGVFGADAVRIASRTFGATNGLIPGTIPRQKPEP